MGTRSDCALDSGPAEIPAQAGKDQQAEQQVGGVETESARQRVAKMRCNGTSTRSLRRGYEDVLHRTTRRLLHCWLAPLSRVSRIVPSRGTADPC